MKQDFSNWANSLPSPTGVLAKSQLKGRKFLSEKGLPNRSQEEWRLSNLNRIKEIFNLPIAKIEQDKISKNDELWPQELEHETRIILDQSTNSQIMKSLPKEVKILDENELTDILNFSSNQINNIEDWCLSINESCASKILGLKIKKNSKVNLEIIIKSQVKALNPSRILIIIEENAHLDLLQVIKGEDKSANSNLIQILMNKDSEINHGFLGLGGKESILFTQVFIQQAENSNYYLTSVLNGWSISRLEPRIFQNKGKAKTSLKGLQVSTNDEQLATHSLVQFNGPEGTLDQLQKSIAADKSHCIFNGAVKVPREAQKTNAAQLSRNLLISEKARIDTKPELEIVADDVKCAHGATVSQLQEEELFYLRSRGITIEKAISLLLRGYCQEIIDQLPLSAKKWNVLNQIINGLNK